jgi:hypothetical protein
VVTSLHRKLLKCPLQIFAIKEKNKGTDWYRKILDPFNDPAHPDLLIEKSQICLVRKRMKVYENESTGSVNPLLILEINPIHPTANEFHQKRKKALKSYLGWGF